MNSKAVLSVFVVLIVLAGIGYGMTHQKSILCEKRLGDQREVCCKERQHLDVVVECKGAWKYFNETSNQCSFYCIP